MSINVINIKGVEQTYHQGGKTIEVIKDFNLTIPDVSGRGEFVSIMGASGCGKSTVLRYIAGLQKPTKGIVELHDKPITSDTHVGMVFQKYSSFEWWTVLENVAYGLQIRGVGKKEREALAMEMIKNVGLEGHEHKYAKYPTLSGGQLQRVAIGRSLLANSSMLLLDEPFGALDVKTRSKQQLRLLDIFYKTHPTILMVTHDISEAVFLSDEIYIMGNPPSKVVYHVKVPLGDNRTRDTKRSPEFIKLVQEVDDYMMALES